MARVMVRLLRVFQLTAARRRLVISSRVLLFLLMFQLTAARRRLGLPVRTTKRNPWVSTHSRPKAAGNGNWWIGDTDTLFQLTAARRRLG